MIVVFKLLLIFSALAGFLLSLTISHKKHAHEKMLCPVGGKCAQVIASEYARFFGIPLEMIGMVYYGIIFVTYTVLFLVGDGQFSFIYFCLFGATITAFLFSLYLTFIQAFTLKQWCTLCLTSALFCTVIFVSALGSSQETFISLLRHYQPLVGSLYLLALSVGLGCATITDVFFLKFLKDYRISESEYDIMRTLSQIMWTALSVLVVAAVGMLITGGAMAGFSSPVIMSWVILAVIIVNGAVLNLIIAPKLLYISFREKHDHEPGELRNIHTLAFELGAVSLVSWYVVYALTLIPSDFFTLAELLLAYGILLILGVAVGRTGEYAMRRKSRIVA